MPSWLLKAGVQGVLSRLPEPQRWNLLFQKYVTKSLGLSDAFFLSKWQAAERHVNALREHRVGGSGNGTPGFQVVELGTGWFPIMSVAATLQGAAHVWTIDLHDLLKRENVLTMLERFVALADRGQIRVEKTPMRRLEQVLRRPGARGPRELLAELGVQSVVSDARETQLRTGSVDLFMSNNTLEHIPADVIGGIFREFARLAAPGAVMSHNVDMADHYATFDKSITVYNYLRYSERQWRWLNNSLQYQNRLRASDFVKIHEDNGWQIVARRDVKRPIRELRSIPIAEEFQRYDEEDLQIYAVGLVSRVAAA